MSVSKYTINRPGSIEESGKDLKPVTNAQRPFTRRNFIFMAICVLLIIVGFLLMSGGGSSDGSFNPDIFSTRRIVVGPLFAFAGFLLMAFAIIYTPKDSDNIAKQLSDKPADGKILPETEPEAEKAVENVKENPEK